MRWGRFSSMPAIWDAAPRALFAPMRATPLPDSPVRSRQAGHTASLRAHPLYQDQQERHDAHTDQEGIAAADCLPHHSPHQRDSDSRDVIDGLAQ